MSSTRDVSSQPSQPVVTQTIQNKNPVIDLNAIDDRLAQTKATKIYGMFAGLKFGYITFKENHPGKFFSVTPEELEARDLYNQHKELHTLISRVQKAYKDYLPAAQAVKEVKHQKNSTKDLNEALENRSKKSVALVASYDALIEKANSQVGSLRKRDIELLDSAEHLPALNDTRRDHLHKALALKNPGILNAIHSSQAQTSVMINLVTAFDGGKLSFDKDMLRTFMLNFEKEVQEASSRSGADPHAVREAFIDGLINTPGINGEIIFSCAQGLYDERKTIKENAGNPTTDASFVKMTSHFASEINSLINRQGATLADINRISYEGISMTKLMSPSAENLRAKLGKLKEWIKEWRKLEAKQALEAEQTFVAADFLNMLPGDAELKIAIAKLAVPVNYTAQEIADLLKRNGLVRLQNEPVTINGYTINGYIDDLSALNGQIESIEASIKENSREREAAIDKLQKNLQLLQDADKKLLQDKKTIIEGLQGEVIEILDDLNLLSHLPIQSSTEKPYQALIPLNAERLIPLNAELRANNVKVAQVKERIKLTEAQQEEAVKKENSQLQTLMKQRDELKRKKILITGDQLLEIRSILLSGPNVVIDDNMHNAYICSQEVHRLEAIQQEKLQTQPIEKERIEGLRIELSMLSRVFDNLVDGPLTIKPEAFFTEAGINNLCARRAAVFESAIDQTFAVLVAFDKRQSELRGQCVDNEYFSGSQEQFLAKRKAAVAPTVLEAQHTAQKIKWENEKQARASSAPSVSNSDTFFDLEAF